MDLFCANAGVAQGARLDAPYDVWSLAWDVNVRSLVLAAREPVPGWLERGHGYFLSTAADEVVTAESAERFLILPHPEALEFFHRKAADYDRWIAGMQRLLNRFAETAAGSVP